MIANYLLMKPDKNESLDQLINLFGIKQVNQALHSQTIKITNIKSLPLTESPIAKLNN